MRYCPGGRTVGTRNISIPINGEIRHGKWTIIVRLDDSLGPTCLNNYNRSYNTWLMNSRAYFVQSSCSGILTTEKILETHFSQSSELRLLFSIRDVMEWSTVLHTYEYYCWYVQRMPIRALSVQKKTDEVRSYTLCFNFLAFNHNSAYQKRKFFLSNGNHNSLLHKSKFKKPSANNWKSGGKYGLTKVKQNSNLSNVDNLQLLSGSKDQNVYTK